jgi:hypothetical protein
LDVAYSGALGILMVVQTLAWLASLAVRVMPVSPKPVPPSEIKTPSTSIGIEEGRGGAVPVPRPNPPQK